MEALILLAEFLSGIEKARHISIPNTVEEMQFFLSHEHQVCSDDLNYEEFENCFPSFFEYSKHEQVFLDWVITKE